MHLTGYVVHQGEKISQLCYYTWDSSYSQIAMARCSQATQDTKGTPWHDECC